MDGILHLKNTGRKDYFYEEAIKTLRTNIQFCGSGLKTIMFTSSMPDEGKSETAFALASSFGNIGKKVLLVDADIRKSVMVKRYEIKGNPNGLSQYLSGQKSLEEICYKTDMENLDMVLSGPFSPNPAELLEDELFKAMIESVKETYDYIIIDTPPMANIIDGAIIASQCDGAVIVIESGAISYRLVQKVRSQLEKSAGSSSSVRFSSIGSIPSPPEFRPRLSRPTPARRRVKYQTRAPRQAARGQLQLLMESAAGMLYSSRPAGTFHPMLPCLRQASACAALPGCQAALLHFQAPADSRSDCRTGSRSLRSL